MTCAVCGNALPRGQAHCAICGHAADGDAPRRWDRRPEAAAYEDLFPALEPDEHLLALTRGRLAGAWLNRLTLNPQALLSSYANLGLTSRRMLLQRVRGSTGRALDEKPAAFPLEQVARVEASEADPVVEGRTVRLIATLCSGDSFRLLAAGRLAEGAREMAEVWRSVSGQHNGSPPADKPCPGCGRPLDRPHRFCPFCGRPTGDS